MENLEERLNNINLAIEKITNKEGKIIFLSPDTKGNARASVAFIYRQALTLKKAGYNVSILIEKNDYIKPYSWLGDEFEELEHQSIEDNKLTVGPQDVIIVPEIFGNVFEQIQQLPVDKILLVQMYDSLLDPYSPGKSWVDMDVYETITTSSNVKKMIESLVPHSVNFINPYIPECFSPSETPVKPIVAIHCRDQRNAARLIKTFYLKYPLFRFISFKDMHGMTEKDFANNLKECIVSVWVDNESTFGTFPLESIKSNVPVIGKVPNIIPEWITDDNGIWVYDENQIPELILNYIKNWMEDSIPDNLLHVNETLKDQYTIESFEKATIETYNEVFNKKIERLNKIKETLNKE